MPYTKPMITRLRGILGWIQKYERHLSAPVFIAGFLNDVFLTYGRLELASAMLVFGLYVIVAAAATIASHYLYAHRGTEGWKLRSLRVLLSLLAQFVTGGLISGFLIFYTRDAALTVSWPFIFLLVIIFIGNEFFRHYREALSFRSILFFFTLYTYLIFALPYALHTLGTAVFLESTGGTIALFALYIGLLRIAGKERFWGSMKSTIPAAVLITILITGSYFTGIIPPLPLALKDAGVYHLVTHVGDTYTLQGEPGQAPWWDIFDSTPALVHNVPGGLLYVYSAVFAPTKFSAGVEHQWQHYNDTKHHWETIATILFPINGGRDGGYRGYSTVSDIQEGRYRVNIRTLTKQVIGRVYFNVISASSTPVLITDTD
jgi:hypothetical protein